MNGCTHFVCESCEKVKPIKRKNVIKVAHTAYNKGSEIALRYHIHYVMICDKCMKGESDK